MANSLAVSRAQLIYAICLPLAVLMGYMLADPQDIESVIVLCVVLAFLSIPAFMRWYQPWLLFVWNAVMTLMFIPGTPPLWVLMAGIAFLFAILNRFTNSEARFIHVPSLTRPILAFVVVLIITAVWRGGLGLQILGSSRFGSRYYCYLLAGVVGYFAIVSRRIPANRANLYAALFFLSSLTALVPLLANATGSSFLLYVFPPGWGDEDYGPAVINNAIFRLYGLNYVAIAICSWLLARHGFRGVFDLAKPWRLGLFLAACLAGVFCGFRASMLLLLFILACQYCFEGYFRPRNLAFAMGAAILITALLVPLAPRLPMVVQRTLSFLPLPINQAVKRDAEISSDWRLRMWEYLLPQVPGYLLLGKGYGFDPNEQQMANLNAVRHFEEDFSGFLQAGDYHSGPFTLIIPFGIWGAVAFCWFLAASVKYLYRNHRYGDPALRHVNTFLLAVFVARVIQFFLVFGMLPMDFPVLIGIVALGVSLNGAQLPEPASVEAEPLEAAFADELVTTEVS